MQAAWYAFLVSIASCATAEVKPAPALQTESEAVSASPFVNFFGTWTLEDDQFQQVWDTETLQTFSIPNHITECSSIDTDKTVLCVVNAGGLKGHILWAYDESLQEVRHLWHFGEHRLGAGRGTMTPSGDLRSEIHFTDEPEGTYRKYEYKWLDKDTYEMKSTQMTVEGSPTGNWYGGIFVRLKQFDGVE
ncbi:MAG: hypothetical protein ACX94B_16960 [Henriciella sp.]